jgi:hypothetical protein
MDYTFILNREYLNRTPSSIVGLLTRPLIDLGNGVYCGFIGLFRDPYLSVRARGFKGVPAGLTTAVVGAFVKPIVGALDAVAHTGDTLKSVAKVCEIIPAHFFSLFLFIYAYIMH